MPRARVLVADDHVLFRMGLCKLLERTGMEVVAEASDGYEALRKAQLVRPDLALLDMKMPGLDGLETARRIKAVCPGTQIVMLSGYPGSAHVADCRRAGAVAFIGKGASGAEVLEVLDTVLGSVAGVGPDEASVSPRDAVDDLGPEEGAPAAVDGVDLSRLTARERQVLSLVAQGHSSAGLAAVLGISVRTVDTHRQNIMGKLGVHTAVGLTRLAIRLGLA